MMKQKVDVAVVGAGPAGLSAAIEAAKAGADVRVFDENLKPGGQLFKQTHKFFGSRAHLAGIRGFDIGKMLLKEAEKEGVKIHLNSVVSGMFPDRMLEIISDGHKQQYEAQAVIVATGAIENSIAFPGWDLPGVMGAGAAQTMININRVLPGRKVLIVGSGNVGLIVGYQLKQSGAQVVAIIEAAPQIGGYGVHSGKVMRAGIPIHLSTTILKAHGDMEVTGATIVKLDDKFQPNAGTEEFLEVDTICIAVGLNPMSELVDMLHVDHVWENRLGGHVPLHNSDMLTSRAGIYIAGDVAGVEEASTAIEEGRMAGVSAAAALGFLTKTEAAERKQQIRIRLDTLRSGSFGAKRRSAKEDIFALYAKVYGEEPLPSCGEALNVPRTAANQVCFRGYPSLEEIAAAGNLPSEERLAKRAVAIVECVQEIPCNPCEASCPFNAIHIGNPITNLPTVDFDKCTGCGKCIYGCPGQAIFTVDVSKDPQTALIKLPWEYLPLPRKGDQVTVVGRDGQPLGKGEIRNVLDSPKYDKTRIVEVAVERALAMKIRSFIQKA